MMVNGLQIVVWVALVALSVTLALWAVVGRRKLPAKYARWATDIAAMALTVSLVWQGLLRGYLFPAVLDEILMLLALLITLMSRFIKPEPAWKMLLGLGGALGLSIWATYSGYIGQPLSTPEVWWGGAIAGRWLLLAGMAAWWWQLPLLIWPASGNHQDNAPGPLESILGQRLALSSYLLGGLLLLLYTGFTGQLQWAAYSWLVVTLVLLTAISWLNFDQRGHQRLTVGLHLAIVLAFIPLLLNIAA